MSGASWSEVRLLVLDAYAETEFQEFGQVRGLCARRSVNPSALAFLDVGDTSNIPRQAAMFRRKVLNMLRRFLYLDERALDGYISALEDGLRVRAERSAGKNSGGEVGADAKFVKAKGSRGRTESESTEVADTSHARFERLLTLAGQDEEEAGWIELQELSGLADAGYGALIHAECEVYVPDAVQMLASQGGAGGAIEAMVEMLPLAKQLGLDMEGVPEAEELKAWGSLTSKLSADLVFVGEDDSGWRVAGKLSAGEVQGDIDGPVRIVGKVSSRWPEGRWKPLLALPGASLLPRKERKAAEAQKPEDDDDDSFLEGPAVMLDVLAIYR